MILKELEIKNKDSLDYAKATFYGHEYTEALRIKTRPVVVISPGGGYEYTSDREAEIIALQFLAKGCHAVVVRYSCSPARYPVALLEFAKAVWEVRAHAEEWHIDPEKVFVMGFSAGAHLAASFCAFREKSFVAEALGCDKEMLRPNGQILCYPVITSGPHVHDGSFHSLLGDAYEEKKEELSLERQVNDSIPRTFVWHTFADGSVPVQNSLLYVSALAEHGIPVEYHLFEKGGHGLGLANGLTVSPREKELEPTATPWIDLLHTWMGRL